MPTLYLHAFSDLAIFFAYVVLGLWCLFAFKVQGLKGAKGMTLRVLFGLFILLCGITHLDATISELRGVCEVKSIFFGFIKTITAVVSLSTAGLVSMLLSMQIHGKTELHKPDFSFIKKDSPWLMVAFVHLLLLALGVVMVIYLFGKALLCPVCN